MMIPDKLQSRKWEAEQVLQWCANGIDQNEFDKLEREAEFKPRPAPFFRDGDYMVNNVRPFLHVCRLLVEEGAMLCERRKDGLIWYTSVDCGRVPSVS